MIGKMDTDDLRDAISNECEMNPRTEFLKELEHNRNINKQIGAENAINIDYVIERIKDILKY